MWSDKRIFTRSYKKYKNNQLNCENHELKNYPE